MIDEQLEETYTRYFYILQIILANNINSNYIDAIDNMIDNFIIYIDHNTRLLKTRFKSLKNIFRYRSYKREFDEYIRTTTSEIDTLINVADYMKLVIDKLNDENDGEISETKHYPSWSDRLSTDSWYSQIKFFEVSDGKPES